MTEPVFGVSDFVAVLNQTLEFAYPSVVVVGELANLRVSKNRWVYFDLKDEQSSVKFFGTVQQLPGPLENGMLLQVRGMPRMHQLYGFSVNVQFMQPVGEGSIKKAAELLRVKLETEGLFEPARKRILPYPPRRIGLITSNESAAYADFIKILNARWGGVEVFLADVQVQGELAVTQIVEAVEYFNAYGEGVDVLVVTRGGGSADDLAAFNTEQVTRVIAASRIPTLVAVGHEIDWSLAEMAADVRASTPSNAAELLTPDRYEVMGHLGFVRSALIMKMTDRVIEAKKDSRLGLSRIEAACKQKIAVEGDRLRMKQQVLEALSPQSALRRGYAIVRRYDSSVVKAATSVSAGDSVTIEFADGMVSAKISGDAVQ